MSRKENKNSKKRNIIEDKRKINKSSRVMFTIGILLILVSVGIMLIKPIQTHILNNNISEYEQNKNKIMADIAKSKRKMNIFDDNKKNNTNKSKNDYNFDSVESLNFGTIIEAKNKVDFDAAVGVIVIPNLKVNIPIFDGLNNHNLTYGAGTMKSNQKMGENNYALAGHNYPNSPSILFSPLGKIKKGDPIYLTDFNYIYKYETVQFKTIVPTSVDVIEDSGINELTLITCNDSGSKRHMVKADFIEKTSIEAADQNLKDLFGFDFSSTTN